MSLPAIFPEQPTWGRAKSPRPTPYATFNVSLEGRSPTGTGTGTGLTWYDNRRVTIKAYARKDQISAIVQQVVAVFNINSTLVFPSGAKFLKLWPDGNAKIYEDPATKEGQDIWIAEFAFIVRSVRQQ